MDDIPKSPLSFANKAIRQFVNNLLGSDVIIAPKDYTVLRVVFRKCGGSWERLNHGDIVHTQLLTKILTSWGSMPGRQREVDTD